MSIGLVFSGLLIHLLLLYSPFDVYYSSPVIRNLPAHEITQGDAPAKRLFFISADGLRHASFVEHVDKRPFLSDVIANKKSVWGTSLSHVPTESRPGHVALLAGITEDVSAVAKGWKKNPVAFDSVVNRSKETWAFGSPDIVHLFSDRPHVHAECYHEDEEDFGGNQAHKLDEWAFDKVENLFKMASDDSQLRNRLHGDRRVFFLHLLGLDTNGHGNKPHSKEYANNIAVVDSGIARLQKLADDFFGDEKSAFVFTADHGMTDWGSHGAGSEHEVHTPFVAWGAGIKRGGQQITINQVDVAPLLSALIGVPVPTNSLGLLPVSVLGASDQYVFQAAFANFLQLKEQLTYLRDAKATRLFFRDYEKFGDKALGALHTQVTSLAKARRFAAASTLLEQHAASLRGAILYYHRYDRGFLGMCISSIFILWIASVVCHLQCSGGDVATLDQLKPRLVFQIVFAAAVLFCYTCGLPFSNWVYVMVPIFQSSLLLNTLRHDSIGTLLRRKVNDAQNVKLSSFGWAGVVFLAAGLFLYCLVWVFADRRALSAICILLAIVPNVYKIQNGQLVLLWRLACALLSIFPFLSTVGRTEYPLLCTVAPLFTSGLLLLARKHPNAVSLDSLLRILSCAHLTTALIVLITSFLFEKTPWYLRLVSWGTVPLVVFVPPLFTPPKLADRMIAFAGALFVPYCLLSIAYESLFCVLFGLVLILLIRIEFAHMSTMALFNLSVIVRSEEEAPRPASTRDVIRASVCVSLVLCALFGTGNFASLNSFNPSTLHRFISVFSPFTMAALLVIKLLLPILMLTLTFAAILRFNEADIFRFSLVTLIITDLMAMYLFHQLRDTGSWLEIGMSISQYVVSMCLSVALLILLLASTHLIALRPSAIIRYLSGTDPESKQYLSKKWMPDYRKPESLGA